MNPKRRLSKAVLILMLVISGISLLPFPKSDEMPVPCAEEEVKTA